MDKAEGNGNETTGARLKNLYEISSRLSFYTTLIEERPDGFETQALASLLEIAIELPRFRLSQLPGGTYFMLRRAMSDHLRLDPSEDVHAAVYRVLGLLEGKRRQERENTTVLRSLIDAHLAVVEAAGVFAANLVSGLVRTSTIPVRNWSRLLAATRGMVEKSPKIVTWNWDTIKGFGESKALRLSFVLLLLVPFCAKAVGALPEKMDVPVLGEIEKADLSLPFQWTVLYGMAVAASLGSAVYYLFCPALVKRFGDYKSFVEADRDCRYLRPILRQLTYSTVDVAIGQQLATMEDVYLDDAIARGEIEMDFEVNRIPPSQNTFYTIRDAANLSRPLARVFASLCYFVAFACLAYVGAENAAWVARYSHMPG